MKKTLSFLLIGLLTCCALSAAVKKTPLRVLYVGGSADMDVVGGEKVDTVALEKSKKGRMAAFSQFLNDYFSTVKVVEGKDYAAAMSDQYDVTIFDGKPKALREREYVKDSTGQIVDVINAEYLPKDFSRAAITIAEMGEHIGRSLGIKNDWYCLCLDADAHHTVTSHPIFQGPYKVTLEWKTKKTPADAYHYQYYADGPIPDSIPMWTVQTKGYANTRGYRIGMVARPWGYTDSPDCEYISSGVCAKTLDAVALGRHANFFHWGFAASPADMTEQGRTVFANAIVYISKFNGKRPIARKWEEHIATKEFVKERRYLATRQAVKDFEEQDKESNKAMQQYSDSLKQLQAQGKELSEMEKFYVNWQPQPSRTYEQMLERYEKALYAQFGTDEQKYLDYFDENRDYFYGGQGFYELSIDEDAKSLGIPVGDMRLLDTAITLWETGKDVEKAKRLLTRYTLLRYDNAKAYRDWYNKYRSKLFWTESGGWFYMVDSEAPNTPGNDYSVIGK